MVRTSKALKIIAKINRTDPGLQEMVATSALTADVAKLIYEARIKAGLTQQQLTELIGTKQPVIARLEDADYEGHSLSMLQGIAPALNQGLEIHLTSMEHEQRV